MKRASKTPPPIDANFEATLSDSANADLLAQAFRYELAWVPELGRWRCFRDHTWHDDDSGEAERRAMTVAQSRFDGLANEPDRARAFKLLAHARHSAQARGIGAMLDLSKACGLTVPEREWNTDAMLLGAPNGVIHLRTGELRAGLWADRISKRIGLAFDPAAKAPLFCAFLDRIMNSDLAMIAFLQRAVGYSLTGDTGEQCLFIKWGCGSNGKSSFLRTMAYVLGDYARACPAESLLSRRDGTIPNDIARLSGARFVTAIETEDGGRLAESLVKALTGGDTITARFLHREFFEFATQLKLWIASNHKPTIKGDDLAIWRRIRLIPFTVTIPEDEQDHELPAKLRAEAAGILNWAIVGCLAWQRDGLQTPEPVRTATATYRTEQDQLGEWIEDRCVLAPNAAGQAGPLFRDYKAWADERNERPMTQTMLGRKLVERGFEKQRSHGLTLYHGIGLQAEGAGSGAGSGVGGAGSKPFRVYSSRDKEHIGDKPEIDSNLHPTCTDDAADDYRRASRGE